VNLIGKSMMNFAEILKSQAIKEQLPFDIDFQFSTRAFKNAHKEVVGGFEIPILNELTVFESWWLGYLDSLAGNSLMDVRLEWRGLALSLKQELNLSFTISECAVLITGQLSEEMAGRPEYEAVINSAEFEDWTFRHEQSYNKLIKLNQLSQSPTILNVLRITAFMKGRVNPDWDTLDSLSLTLSQSKAIMALITKEANGGVEPANEEEQEDEAPKKLKRAKVTDGE
jgi:hypothetical protein